MRIQSIRVRGVVELDAVTGEMRNTQALMARLSRTVTRDSLFDVGADTISLLVPGGGIALKMAKMAIDAKSQRSSS